MFSCLFAIVVVVVFFPCVSMCYLRGPRSLNVHQGPGSELGKVGKTEFVLCLFFFCPIWCEFGVEHCGSIPFLYRVIQEAPSCPVALLLVSDLLWAELCPPQIHMLRP